VAENLPRRPGSYLARPIWPAERRISLY